MGKRKTHQQFVKDISDRPLVAIGEYEGSHHKILFSCDVCSNEWSAVPNSILNGSGCPKCANKKRSDDRRGENKILEDHVNWLLVDISTPTHPEATMAVDTDVWDRYEGGRVFAWDNFSANYIYACSNQNRGVILFHRLVLPAEKPLEVDHITHGSMDFIDNRKSNLRTVTRSQNSMNKGIYSSSSSGRAGVIWDKRLQKWRAHIGVNGKTIYLGTFDNINIAVMARKQAECEYFGEHSYRL